MATAVPEEFENKICHKIRGYAMALPDATEGTSCVNRAFKAGGKNFVFLGEKGDQITMRLKLDASIPVIEKHRETSEGYEVGTGGWTKLVFTPETAPKAGDLKTWITESFLLLAPKKVAAKL